jgi:hypothetical protein
VVFLPQKRLKRKTRPLGNAQIIQFLNAVNFDNKPFAMILKIEKQKITFGNFYGSGLHQNF